MSEIIGGMFGLQLDVARNSSNPSFLADDPVLFVNASSAMAVLVDRLGPGTVWLPSFLCPSMVDAARHSSSTIQFFGVNERLSLTGHEWLDDVQSGDLIILIDYFGLPHDTSCIEAARSKGAFILEDASQALLSSHVGRHADFIIYSPRKFLGVPDGGILECRSPIDLENLDLRPPPAEWWLDLFRASVLRREFDLHGGSREWYGLFQTVEAQYPIGRFAMSDISAMLLSNAFDYPKIIHQRTTNYQVLADQLSDLALYPVLDSESVPLGFPVRISNRSVVQESLFRRNHYCPVHWNIDGIVPKSFDSSHRLSREILTLPCDQRYCKSDMERLIQGVRKLIDVN